MERKILTSNALFLSRIVGRLQGLFENVGSPFKQGEMNQGRVREKYNSAGVTGSVIQGVDTPQELFTNTELFINERFTKTKNKGNHLVQRLKKIFRSLCLAHAEYCITLEENM